VKIAWKTVNCKCFPGKIGRFLSVRPSGFPESLENMFRIVKPTKRKNFFFLFFIFSFSHVDFPAYGVILTYPTCKKY